MPTVNEILDALLKVAPLSLAEGFDNPGFLVGRGGREVKKVLVALDITSDVVREAAEIGAELIVSHHPVIFTPRTNVCDGDVMGNIILSMIENNIAAICMHTNLDSARGGVNDILAEALGLSDTEVIEPKSEDPKAGLGRCGNLEQETKLCDFMDKVCKTLSVSGVKYHDAARSVHRVCVGGGACGDFVSYAKAFGFDTIVTSDIKHNYFLEAQELGINAVDAGHFATENIVCPKIEEIIKSSFPSLSVSQAKANVDCTDFFTI